MAVKPSTLAHELWSPPGMSREAFEKERERIEAYGAVRDDIMSLVKNSGMSFQDIHNRCGPHPATLEKWARKETERPQMSKMISVLRILGFTEFVIRL